MKKNTTLLNEKNFDSFIEKGISVVDFWAEWCGPCKMMAPIFEETAEKMKSKVNFGKVNIDENSEIAQKFEVMSIPTLIFFKNGKQVDRAVGLIDKEEIIKKIREIE